MMSMSTLPASQGVPTPPSMGVSSLARPPSAYQPNGFYPSAHGRGISVSDGGNRSVSMSFSSVDGSGAGANQGRMSVAVDFGTTFSGVAFASARISAGQVQQILHWPGSSETFRKIPTCLVYDENGKIIAWGLEAKNTPVHACFIKCEWFKLFLEPHALRNEDAVDSRLPQLPPGKTAIDVIIDFLSCIWEYAKGQITRQLGSVADLDSADIILTVPAAWDAKGCELMRDAAISAGLVQSSRAGDKNWRDRLRIITEPEAAAVHCATMTDVHRLKTSQNFMICDAGGGTVDLAVYKILGQLANLEIAEICARSGANCGSLFLDLRFRSLVETLLADYPAHLDPPSMANFMRAFSENEKLEYRGVDDDGNMIQFSCFNVQPDDPSVGLINGELVIPGKLVFLTVDVLDLVEEQLKKAEQRIDALLLVGGFSGSEYLFKRVNEQFGGRIRVIARPVDADTATLRGAAKHGLGGRNVVSSTIVPRSYIMKVKLPAESEDWLKRPAYIKSVDGGTPVCENRLQYLVTKGAILRRGQRVITKFCKYSQSSQDRIFVATLYTSDSDKVMRYNDEGETDELCKWTVDLGALPVFQQNAAASMGNGFYTEFELGLEFDSAEVRGVLLYDGQEWGKIVFDFLS
ncbi:actin-like ATPase domain-containing protein [Punctularia strigosozonata HHB-11173 SS5]|uniref:actin-like ATPase domain-containing protein n=1 Tax=Punctularia strigosozonata (strain HHB-11173) TaxID=741275 RepID=UPI0004416B57|nr:actin-like ATPase domain-containing protein [Punctularia strigosozonata HHB-11173 SS5]EIN05832.1 actin-like ATPase domain-containing protein [Punctularia strigosozonata HHB-11173 SS5]